MRETKTFSRIPMRTWRWLGVNDLPAPADLDDAIKKEQILVQKGQRDEIVRAFRTGGNYEVQVHLEAGAALHLVLAQLAPQAESCTCRVRVRCAAGAKFAATLAEVGARHAAAELFVDLAEEGAGADVWGLYFGDGEQKLDLNYVIRQGGTHTDANMQVRGALKGHAEKIFRGTLDFLEGSSGSVGRENEEVVLLSDGVRNRSVPIMLSHEADVDGHHAVSVGKMDEDRLFYLMSRGLDLAEAQRLVVEASLAPVLSRIPDAALRGEIDQFLQERITNG